MTPLTIKHSKAGGSCRQQISALCAEHVSVAQVWHDVLQVVAVPAVFVSVVA